ncbi:hypothetical protein V7654_20275 [Bacillus sp. JJ1609]|uniref:hypothetical protein n=1 Tax=Bacillus sp. JJ1609 TaxID=3122977 RepID=UPI002FFFD338
MDGLLFLKIIDWIQTYGLQVIGIIIVIILSRYFIQTLLWVISLAVKLILGVIQGLLSMTLIILNIMPASLQEKMNRLIVNVESFIRKMEKINRMIKGWFEGAPKKYVKVHFSIVRFIRSAAVLFVVASVLVLVVNVFIQKTLTVEQILMHISTKV